MTGTATANVAVNDNYNITVTPTTIDITAAPLTVTTNDGTRVYDGQDFTANHNDGTSAYQPTMTFALSGDGNKAPVPAAVQLDYTDLAFAKDVKDAGTYSWTVKSSGLTKIYKALGSKTGVADDANYAITADQLTGKYSITPAAITIAAPTLTKVYDGAVEPETANVATITGNLTNGKALMYSLTNLSGDTNVGTYPITVTVNGSDNPDYMISVKAGSLAINPKPITFALTDTSFVYDGKKHTMPLPTDLSTGVGDQKAVLALTDDTQTEVGSHQVTGSASTDDVNKNYTITVIPATLHVTADAVTPTFKSDSKTYDGNSIATSFTPVITVVSKDTENPVQMPKINLTTGDYSYTAASADGKSSASVDPTTEMNAGTYTWYLTADGIKDVQRQLTDNFDAGDLSKLSGTYTINKKSITVTLTPVKVQYDGTQYSITPTAAQLSTGINKDQVAVTLTNAELTDVGKNKVTGVPTADSASNKNYDVTVKDTTLEVTPAPITITAPTLTKVYDGQAYTGVDNVATVTGMPQTGKKLAYTMTAVDSDVDAGTYPITVTATDDSNYTISVKAGSLVINPKSITFALTDTSFVYDGKEHTMPMPTNLSTGVGDQKAVLALTDDTQTEVGSHQVTASASSADVNKNYTITVTPANITVTAANITPTITNVSKVYDGQSISTAYTPTFTLSAIDSKNQVAVPTIQLDAGDYNYTTTAVDGKTITIDPTTEANAGTYTWHLTADGIAKVQKQFKGNFDAGDLSKISGMYTITPAAITITAPTLNKVYDGKAYTGANNIAKVTGKPVNGKELAFKLTDLSNVINAGTTTLTVITSGNDNPDYTITVINGSLTIKPRAVTVTADSLSKDYDATDPTLTATISGVTGNVESGLVNGDTLNYTVTRETGEKPGAYITSVTNDTNPNYTITDATGTFTITPVVTIEYVDQDGKELAAQPTRQITGQKVGETITIDQPSVEGYTLGDGQQASYTLTAKEPQLLTVKYAQNTSITVNYYIKGTTTSLAPSVTINSSVGETYSTSPITKTGYTLVATPANATGTYGVTNADVDYKYAPDTESVQVNYYVKGSTNTITDSSTLMGQFAGEYSSEAATVKGYTLVETPTNAKGTYGLSNGPVNYYYTVDYTAVPIDSNGQAISNAAHPTGTGTPGQTIDPTGGMPIIPGYTVTTTLPEIPNKPGQVNVVYTPNDESVQVNYYIQGTTTSLKPSTTVNGKFGESYTTSPATVTGYHVVSTPVNVTGTYGVTNTGVTYEYAPDDETVKVNYFIQGTTNALTPSTTQQGKFGDNYTTAAATVTGYHLVGKPTNATGTYGVTSTDVTYEYAPDDEHVKANYYIKDTTTALNPSTTLTGKFGTGYTTTVKTIAGYHLVATPTNTTGTYNVTNADVNYEYAPDTESVRVNYYVKGSKNTITDSSTLTGPFDSDYTATAATVKGYTLVSTPINAKGTYSLSNESVNYYYTIDYTAVPVDDNGQKIPNAVHPTGTGVPGQTINPTGGLPVIPGYTLTTTPNVPDKPNQVNVVYTPITELVKVNYYVQDTTTSLNPSSTISGKFGEGYTTSPATVTGYHLVATPTNATGTYGVTNADVNYEYAPDTESVQVNYYVKGSTNTITDSSTLTGQFAGEYSSEASTVKGYTLVETPTNAKGTYGLSNESVNYYYTVNYTVISVDDIGNKVPNVPTKTGTGTPGDPINPNGGLPMLPGYTLTTTPNVPDKPGQISVVYTRNTENINVNYFVKDTKIPLAASTVLSGPFGSHYETKTVIVPGYMLVETPANALGTYDLKTKTVTYYFVPVSETVQVNYYVKDSTTTIKPSTTLAGAFKSDYTATPATVVGYTLVSTPDNATGVYGLTEQSVNYYYTVNYTAIPVDNTGKAITGVTAPTGTGTPGETIKPTGDMPTIPGYTVTTTLPNVPDKPGQVNVVYTPNTESVKSNYYIQGTKTAVTPSTTQQGKFGENYMTTAATITGYHVVSTPTNATGTYGVTNDDVTYEYAPDAETVMVNYYVAGSKKSIVPSQTLTGLFASKYTTTAATLNGYTLTETPTNANGTYAVTNTEINYYYTVDYTAVPKTSSDQKTYDGQSIATVYTPAITIKATNSSDTTTVPEVKLNADDYTFVDASGNAVNPESESNLGDYTWKLTNLGIQHVQTQLGTSFTTTDLSGLTGNYRITAAPTTAMSLTGTGKTYDGTQLDTTQPLTLTIATLSSSKTIVLGASDYTIANNGKNVGGYDTRLTSAGESKVATAMHNYTVTNLANIQGTLQITKKDLTLQANSDSKDYGQTDKGLAFSSTGLVTGDKTTDISVSRETGENVGTYAVHVNVPTDSELNTNYDIKYINGTFTINKAAVQAANIKLTAASKVYDGKAIPSTFAVTDTVANNLNFTLPTLTAADFSTTLPTTAVKNGDVGDYQITLSPMGLKALQDANPNLTISGVTDATYSVTPATLTVTTANNQKTFGDKDPRLALGTLSGVQVGDNISVATTTRDAGESAGQTYRITSVLNADAHTLSNYKVVNAGAIFTINKRTIAASSLQLGSDSKVYDGKPLALTDVVKHLTLTNTADASAVKLDQSTLTADDFTVTPATQDNNTLTNAGHYTVSLTQTGVQKLRQANPNLSIEDGHITGTFEITKAPLSISVNSENIVYNGTEHTPHVTFTGLVAGDQADNDNINLTGGPILNVQSYTVTPGLTQTSNLRNNYDISFVAGNITVTPADAKASIVNGSKVYDGEPISPSFKLSSQQNLVIPTNFTRDDFIITDVIKGNANLVSAGTYQVQISDSGLAKLQSANPNFKFASRQSIHPGTYVINKANLLVTANNQHKTIGDQDLDLSYTTVGLKGNDTIQAHVEIGSNPTQMRHGHYELFVAIENQDQLRRDYNIVMNPGLLYMSAKLVKADQVEIGSDHKAYDGKPVSISTALFKLTIPDYLQQIPDFTTQDFVVTPITGTTDLTGVGTYTIALSSSGMAKLRADNSDYQLAGETDGVYTITPAKIDASSLKPVVADKVYDTKPVATTYKLDVPSSITVPDNLTDADFVLTHPENSLKNVGRYTVSLSKTGLAKLQAANPNFDITGDPAISSFNITPAPLTVTMKHAEKVFGDPDRFSSTVDGWLDDVPYQLVYTRTDMNEDKGIYSVDVKVTNAQNYKVKTIGAPLTINSYAALDVTNIKVKQGTNWHPSMNFVSAKNDHGISVNWTEFVAQKGIVENADKVDTSKPGVYKVTYIFGDPVVKTATVTVVAPTTDSTAGSQTSQASQTSQHSQGSVQSQASQASRTSQQSQGSVQSQASQASQTSQQSQGSVQSHASQASQASQQSHGSVQSLTSQASPRTDNAPQLTNVSTSQNALQSHATSVAETVPVKVQHTTETTEALSTTSAKVNHSSDNEKRAELPHTGEHDDVAAAEAGLGLLGTLLAFAGFKRRKKREDEEN